jgi:perosamine synthetase
MIPYGKQTINEDDINSVLKVFQENEMLTCGKYVDQFENEICKYADVKYGVAVNSGTAALHLAMFAIDIKEGDEVIVPAISFVASSNCILYQKGKPVFCDILPNTLCIDYTKIESLITNKTKAIVIVDMCGNPCDYDEVKNIADKYNLFIIQDAAHSLGAAYKNRKVGSYADITCFSFHPVKNITTCEGGMMVTNNENFYIKGKQFRSHGITKDFKNRDSHYYEMYYLGYNYRIPDVLCALGTSQIKNIDNFIERRNYIAEKYNSFFNKHEKYIEILENKYYSAYHIYVIKLKNNNRDEVFKKLKESNITCNVHYLPIYLHPYYKNIGYREGLCPISEDVYKKILTLPIFPMLKDNEIEYICNTLINIISNKI